MKILFLSRWYPFPPTNGSKLRINGLLEYLAREHDVTLLSFVEPDEPANAQGILSALRVQTVRRQPFNPDALGGRLALFRRLPRSVIATYSPEMATLVQESIAGSDPDLVIASQIDMAVYSALFNRVPAILEEIELGVMHEQVAAAPSTLAGVRPRLTWWKHRAYVRRVLANFAACTVVSDQERDLLAAIVGDSVRIEVVPNSIDVAAYDAYTVCGAKTTEEPDPTLIFAGSFSFAPNYEAMSWFVSNVFPTVRDQCPRVKLVITGDHAGLQLPDMSGVTLTGMVDDVRPLIASATVSLAPIFTGGGSRLKILEAMALRTPVAATPKGAEGLNVEEGKHLLVADRPDAFAEAVLGLLRSPAERQMLADNAYELVQSRYNSAVVCGRLADLAANVASGTATP